MIEFVLSDADLAEVRFAVSPLHELTLSLRVVHDPGRYPLHLPWSRRLARLRPRLDMAVLGALTNDRGWTPDFLSPRPDSPFTRIEEDLARVRSTPPQQVRDDLHAIHGRIPTAVAGRPGRVLERIADAIENYWHLALAEHWDRMRTILEADIVYRGRLLTQAGLDAMFADISDRISFHSPVVRVRIAGVAPRRIETKGAGLTLLPTLFALHTGVPVDPTAPPILIYAARGTGTLWETPHNTSSAALDAVLGRVRAQLLTSLTEPASSTDLARRNGVSTSAINQHLRALRDVGLLTSTRYGRSVLYLRSELGDALVRPQRP